MSTSKPSGESSETAFPRRPPEVDQFVDRFLSIVCETSRRYILELLAAPEDTSGALREMRSGEIARALGLSPAATSEHLRHLSDLRLVAARREGNTVYYRVHNPQLVHAFRELLQALDAHHAARQSPAE